MTDYARIAVLQTEREHIRRELERSGTPRNAGTPMAERFWVIEKAIREGLDND